MLSIRTKGNCKIICAAAEHLMVYPQHVVMAAGTPTTAFGPAEADGHAISSGQVGPNRQADPNRQAGPNGIRSRRHSLRRRESSGAAVDSRQRGNDIQTSPQEICDDKLPGTVSSRQDQWPQWRGRRVVLSTD